MPARIFTDIFCITFFLLYIILLGEKLHIKNYALDSGGKEEK